MKKSLNHLKESCDHVECFGLLNAYKCEWLLFNQVPFDLYLSYHVLFSSHLLCYGFRNQCNGIEKI